MLDKKHIKQYTLKSESGEQRAESKHIRVDWMVESTE